MVTTPTDPVLSPEPKNPPVFFRAHADPGGDGSTGAHVAWFHIAVDVVGEVRGTVFCSHFEQQTVILRIGPVKIGCDGVGRDRVLEPLPVGISLDHRLNKCPVDHIHLFFTITICKVLFFPAHDRRQIGEVIWNSPVQCD